MGIERNFLKQLSSKLSPTVFNSLIGTAQMLSDDSAYHFSVRYDFLKQTVGILVKQTFLII